MGIRFGQTQLTTCHCEERSDEAMLSAFGAHHWREIASSLRSSQ
jgi:hypothetical protein